jgi:hypothetical protein
MVDELQGCLNEAVKQISRELERIGYDEIQYQQSDGYIEEELLANKDNDYFRFNRRGEHVGCPPFGNETVL